MVYSSRNYWVFALCPSSDIIKNIRFRKLDLFPSSDEGEGGDTYSVGPVRRGLSEVTGQPTSMPV
jgi:hypothetical protein